MGRRRGVGYCDRIGCRAEEHVEIFVMALLREWVVERICIWSRIERGSWRDTRCGQSDTR